MKHKLLIVADDFTGAHDTGVQFRKKDLDTIVVTDFGNIDENIKKCDVLVIDTESRFDSHEKAYSKYFQIGKDVKDIDEIKHVYKKIDSTLRGNIGAEISGLLDGLGAKRAIITPALPNEKRIVLNGNLLIGEYLLENSEFVKDTKSPVDSSNITAIIKKQTEKNVVNFYIDDIRKGKKNLFELIEGSSEDQIFVLDAVDSKDLQIISKTINLLGDNTLVVGSAGLAEMMSETYDLQKEKRSNLMVVGSTSVTTQQQVEYLLKSRDVEVISMDVKRLLNKESYEQELERLVDMSLVYINEGKDILIRSSTSKEDVNLNLKLWAKEGYESYEVSEKIGVFLGEVIARILQKVILNGLFLTGGDTAIKVAKALGALGIRIEGEITSGIPYGKFAGCSYNYFNVITKAGGFGKESSLVEVIDFLKNIKEENHERIYAENA